jgi:tRNA (cytidine/uridine-2'-O-)-methyltransferase
MVDIVYHDSIEDFLQINQKANLNFISKKASKTYENIDFSGEVFLIFGKETAGLPDDLLKKKWERCYRIPMKVDARSLNLSNAVAIVVYEACRQKGFDSLQLDGSKEFD